MKKKQKIKKILCYNVNGLHTPARFSGLHTFLLRRNMEFLLEVFFWLPRCVSSACNANIIACALFTFSFVLKQKKQKFKAVKLLAHGQGRIVYSQGLRTALCGKDMVNNIENKEEFN
jgi:hypothetical protein